MGIELHAVLEFSGMTKGEAHKLVDVIKSIELRELTRVGTGRWGSNTIKAAADAQLHGKSFDDLVAEAKERQGSLEASRRISVFVTADNAAVAQIRLNELYRKLNAMPSYGCEIVEKSVSDGETYRRVV